MRGARLCQRPAGDPLRSGHGQALRRERAAEPRSHRSDGRRADDRARARHVHRGPGERHEGVEPRRDRGSGDGPVHADRPGRVQPVRRRTRPTAIARSPEVEVASGVRGGLGQDRGPERPDHRHRPEDDHAGLQVRLDRTAPTRRSTSSAHFGAIVEKQFADDANLKVGDRFSVTSASDKETPLEVKGIYKAPPFHPLLGSISILTSKFDTALPAAAEPVHVHRREGRAEHGAENALEPGGRVLPGREGADQEGLDRLAGSRTSTTSCSRSTSCSRCR